MLSLPSGFLVCFYIEFRHLIDFPVKYLYCLFLESGMKSRYSSWKFTSPGIKMSRVAYALQVSLRVKSPTPSSKWLMDCLSLSQVMKTVSPVQEWFLYFNL